MTTYIRDCTWAYSQITIDSVIPKHFFLLFFAVVVVVVCAIVRLSHGIGENLLTTAVSRRWICVYEYDTIHELRSQATQTYATQKYRIWLSIFPTAHRLCDGEGTEAPIILCVSEAIHRIVRHNKSEIVFSRIFVVCKHKAWIEFIYFGQRNDAVRGRVKRVRMYFTPCSRCVSTSSTHQNYRQTKPICLYIRKTIDANSPVSTRRTHVLTHSHTLTFTKKGKSNQIWMNERRREKKMRIESTTLNGGIKWRQ